MNKFALISLWNHTQQHPGTSGARACAGVLLSLYNGARFPFDLTDLRLLDKPLLTAALDVITADSTRCVHEVHEWLRMFTGIAMFGARFEALAWEYNCFKRGRCKRDELVPAIVEQRFVFKLEEVREPVGLGARRQAAMTDDLSARTNQPVFSTPFLDDLAG